MAIVLYADEQTISVDLSGLTNNTTGEFIDDAEVEFTIYECGTDNEIDGTWPVEMTASGSDGNYTATTNTDLCKGNKYTITITVTSGDNVATFSEEVLAKVRRF